jgi:hypothetical protein
MVKDHNPLANLELIDSPANGCNDACGFMPKDARGGVGAGVDLLEIGAANTTGVNLDEDFACADFGNGNSFDAHVVDAAINSSAHCGWDDGSMENFRRGESCTHSIRDPTLF